MIMFSFMKIRCDHLFEEWVIDGNESLDLNATEKRQIYSPKTRKTINSQSFCLNALSATIIIY